MLHANSTRLTVAITSLSSKTTRGDGTTRRAQAPPRMHRTPRWRLEPDSLSALLLQRDPGSWPQALEPPRQCAQTATAPGCQSRAGRHPEDTVPQEATSTRPSTQCSHGDHRSPSHSPPGGATACTHRSADHGPGSSDHSAGGLLERGACTEGVTQPCGAPAPSGLSGPWPLFGAVASPAQLPASLQPHSMQGQAVAPWDGCSALGDLKHPYLSFPPLPTSPPPFSSITVATTCDI